MFAERFQGSAVHGRNRPSLSFEGRLLRANVIKDEWAFVWDDSLRYNIAYALQDVHFGVLLVNEYNVFWTPEAMIFKHALVQVASVAEAVLQYDLKLIEDDPRVKETLGSDWVWVDWKEIPLPGIVVPEGQRAVTGLQRRVEKETLDRNSKMQVLIRASRKVEIIDNDIADELDELRKTRNRIHIKSLDDPECTHYTAKMANDALDLLERYRVVALNWTANQRAESLQTMTAALNNVVTTFTPAADDDIDWSTPTTSTSTPTLAVDDLVVHSTLGEGVVMSVEPNGVVTVRFFSDGSARRLMIAYAPLVKTGVMPAADDDLPF